MLRLSRLDTPTPMMASRYPMIDDVRVCEKNVDMKKQKTIRRLPHSRPKTSSSTGLKAAAEGWAGRGRCVLR